MIMLANRVREFTITTGTGDITLGGAMSGHLRFADAFTPGDSVIYVIEDGENYEIGTGTLTDSDTLARTDIAETLEAGVLTKSGATAIALSGQAVLFCATTAEFLLRTDFEAGTISEATPGEGVRINGDLIASSETPQLRLSDTGSSTQAYVRGSEGIVGLEAHAGKWVRTLVGGTEYNRQSETLFDVKTAAQFVGPVTIQDNLTVNAGTDNGVATFESTDSSAFIFFKDSATSNEQSVGIGATADTLRAFAGVLGPEVWAASETLFDVKTAVSSNSAYRLTGTGANAGIDGVVGLNAYTAGAVGFGSTSAVPTVIGVNSLPAITIGTDRAATFAGNVSISGNRITRPASSGNLALSGGDTTSTSGVIVLYGNTDPTNANDIFFLASGGNRLQWDSSANHWDFHGHSVTGMQTISRGASTASVVVSGGSEYNLGANLLIYGENHANRANDMALRSGINEWFHWDDSAGAAYFNYPVYMNGNILGAVGGITSQGNVTVSHGNAPSLTLTDTTAGNRSYISSSDSAMTFSTDAENTISGSAMVWSVDSVERMRLGNTGITNAGGMWIRGGQTVTLTLGSDSNTSWGLADNNTKSARLAYPHYENTEEPVALLLGVSDGGNNFVNIGGGSSIMNAATSLRFHTAGNGSTTSGALRLEIKSNGIADFQGNQLTGVDQVLTGLSTGVLNLTGGDAFNAGGNIALYAQAHPTQANDIAFRTDGSVIRLQWDHSEGYWAFHDNNLTAVPGIFRGTAANDFILSGGSGYNLGAWLQMYGESHATQAHDIVFYQSATKVLQYDHSQGYWHFLDIEVVSNSTFAGGAGSAATATFAVGNANHGFYRHGSNNVGVTANGIFRAAFGSTTVTNNSGLWVTNGANVSLVVGGDGDNTAPLTDNKEKVGRIASPHYTNTQAPMALVMGQATATQNIAYYGGGSGKMTAATRSEWYAAANNTTTTGTLQMFLTTAGLDIVNGLTIGGTLNAANLPEYANDNDAGVGGLTTGDIYRTPTGEVRWKLAP